MPEPVIGLIGCGFIGRFHSRNLRGALRSELVPGEYVAVCDREIERAESFARHHWSENGLGRGGGRSSTVPA